MERFVKGDVVIIPFPFSDLSSSKKRPALVLADLPGEDIILCQITSKNTPKDRFSISLNNLDFADGGLLIDSNIRPQRLFTSEKQIIIRKVGRIDREKLSEVKEVLINLIK